MTNQMSDQIEALMRSLHVLQVPCAWFSTIETRKGHADHTAILLLADILAAYSDKRSVAPECWDGDELLLEYKRLAARFGVSDRSISRAVDLLVKGKLVRRSRQGRKVGVHTKQNIVGVIPNLAEIARLSRAKHGDTLSSRGGRTGRRWRDETDPWWHKLPPSQEALVNTYMRDFEDLVGAPYRADEAQQRADERAARAVTGLSVRDSGRKFAFWGRQYLAALKAKAEQEHGDVLDMALDRRGLVKPSFTLEEFLAWAMTDDPLPDGTARRSVGGSHRGRRNLQ